MSQYHPARQNATSFGTRGFQHSSQAPEQINSGNKLIQVPLYFMFTLVTWTNTQFVLPDDT